MIKFKLWMISIHQRYMLWKNKRIYNRLSKDGKYILGIMEKCKDKVEIVLPVIPQNSNNIMHYIVYRWANSKLWLTLSADDNKYWSKNGNYFTCDLEDHRIDLNKYDCVTIRKLAFSHAGINHTMSHAEKVFLSMADPRDIVKIRIG
jgi:hypothetical protein